VKRWLETRQVLAAIDRAARASSRGEASPAEDGSAPGRRDAARPIGALATVIRVRGSAYRHEGAKLFVPAEGEPVGNVSGGCLEEDVREVARRVMESGIPERRTYCGGSNEIAAWDLGVGCEGEVEILIEPVPDARDDARRALEAEEPFVIVTPLDAGGPAHPRVLRGPAAAALIGDGRSRIGGFEGRESFLDVLEPPPRLLIVSAGDDARHLARLAADVGFRVVVADRRPGLLAPERFPAGSRLVETDAAQLGERIVLDAASFAVVMTHHFADDTDYLRALLRSPVGYLGVLGPRSRTDRILGILRAGGPVDEARIFGPVGLDIGTDGAEQVALAILAEILAVRSGRRPRSLRDRRAPIHAAEG
jgi:xanthine dehydrogenase accessory factor